MRSEGTNPLSDFAAFYSEHAERVLVFLTRRCLDPEVAVDLMAETFSQAYEGRRRFRGTSDAEASAWVFGIARHQLSGYFKRGRAERKALSRLGIEVPPVAPEDFTRIEELAGLGTLRGGERAVRPALHRSARRNAAAPHRRASLRGRRTGA